jgi:hypothetical protein
VRVHDSELKFFFARTGFCDDNKILLGSGKKSHLCFSDPAKASSIEEEVLDAFRQVRDEITKKILKLLAGY